MFFFLFQSDKNSGCYGNLQLPLPYNGENEKKKKKKKKNKSEKKKVKKKKWKKRGIYCYLAAGMTKVLQKYSLSSSLLNVSFLSKPLNLIGCHDNQNAKFVENKNKKSSP